jgi:hypothetical protein
MPDEAPVISRRTFARLAAAAAPLPLLATPARPNLDDALRSEFLMRLRFEYPHAMPAPPQAAAIGQTIVEIAGGTFAGPKLKGTIVPPSGQWSHGHGERPFGPEIRLTLRTDDDELIFVQFRGIVPARAGTECRIVPWFEAGAAKYAWLNNRINIGVGAYPPGATGTAEYRIYQIL